MSHSRFRTIAGTVALGGLVLLYATACDAPTASRPEAAYNPTALTGGLLYRWKSGSTVRVWVMRTASGSPLDLGVATRLAMQQWNNVAGFNEYVLKSADRVDLAEILVYDGLGDPPVSPGSCAFEPRGSAGYTFFCPGPARTESIPQAELLWLNEGGPGVATVVIRVDRSRVTSQSAYNAIVAHEMGHALGIGGHSDDPADLMFALPTVETPSERDRATLRWLLGRSPALLL